MERYYFYDENSNAIYVANEMKEDNSLIFLGSSINPNKRMAAASFTHKMKKKTGWVIRDYPE